MVTLEAQLQQEPHPAVVSDPAQMQVAIYLPPHLPCPTCKLIPYEKTVLEAVVATYKPGTVFQEQTIVRLQETNVGLTEAHEALKEARQDDILRHQAETDASADTIASLTQERDSAIGNHTRKRTLRSAAENEVEELKRKLNTWDDATELLKVRLHTFERYLPQWKDTPE